MSLQSERLLGHMQRLRLSHLPCCYETLAEAAAEKDLPYLDFLEQALEAESAAKHSRNVRLKTQWAHFPYNIQQRTGPVRLRLPAFDRRTQTP